jgi:hypothetical protein
MGKRSCLIAGAALSLALVVSGCKVDVNKNTNGEDKDVSIQTPFGGLQVHNGDTGAASMGLPAYPGAVLTNGDGGDDKSVNLQMGFGKWQMHVQVANYVTSDPEAKVEAFYQKALGSYGQVLTCRGDEAVGQPSRTADGLTCSDDESDHANVHVGRDHDLELKSGSRRHQHIVALKTNDGGTKFALVALTLPDSGKSNSDED